MDFKQKLLQELKIIKDLFDNKQYGYLNFKIKLNYKYLRRLKPKKITKECNNENLKRICFSVYPRIS